MATLPMTLSGLYPFPVLQRQPLSWLLTTVVRFGLLLKFLSVQMSGFYSFVTGFFFFLSSTLFAGFVHVAVFRDSLYVFIALEYSTV